MGSRRDLEKWLTPSRVFQSMGLEDNAAGRRAFRAFLEAKAAEIVMSAESKSPVREWEELSRSWYAGTESFRDWLVDRIDAVVHPHKRASYAGAEMQLHDEKVAESLLVKGLKALAVELEQVQAMRKIDPRKQGLAWLIKSHTVVGDQWVGQRLRMGDRSNISRAVNCFRNPKDSERQRVKALLHKCTD